MRQPDEDQFAAEAQGERRAPDTSDIASDGPAGGPAGQSGEDGATDVDSQGPLNDD
jgi:hypothetical protein